MTKNQIIKAFITLVGYDEAKRLLSQTVSCYSEEDTNYCGSCRSCFRKWNALYQNHIKLKFHNTHLMNEYYQRAKENQYDPERNKSIIMCLDDYIEEHKI